MELALNLSWLVVTGLLFLSVFVAHRRGQLHLSLKLALGCAAVLALLLFPVISMTDDLQQASLLSEWPAGHTAGNPDAAGEAKVSSLVNPTLLLCMLLLAIASAVLVLLSRLIDARKSVLSRVRQQPSAVRPPPFLSCQLAA